MENIIIKIQAYQDFFLLFRQEKFFLLGKKSLFLLNQTITAII